MVLYEVADSRASSWYRPVSTSQCEKRIRREGDAQGISRLPMLRPAWDQVWTEAGDVILTGASGPDGSRRPRGLF